jgi:hypothetical protein
MSPGKSTFSHTLDIPEEKFLFSISAANEFYNLSKHTQKELLNSPLRGTIMEWGMKVVVNGSQTKPASDLNRSPLAFIVGNVMSVRRKKFIDGLWTLGGCSILLRMIDESTSEKEMEQTMSILVCSISDNWRSLAEMEREQMYELLAHILKKKQDYISNSILDSIFALIGRRMDNSAYFVPHTVILLYIMFQH